MDKFTDLAAVVVAGRLDAIAGAILAIGQIVLLDEMVAVLSNGGVVLLDNVVASSMLVREMLVQETMAHLLFSSTILLRAASIRVGQSMTLCENINLATRSLDNCMAAEEFRGPCDTRNPAS